MVTNTGRTFRDKWEKNPDLAFEQTLREGSAINDWILHRNGFHSTGELRAYLAERRRILDAGCGNGRVTALLQRLSAADTEILAVDAVSADVARGNLADLSNVEVRDQDLLGDLSDLGTFDFIYCQEVLHHTGDARGAFLNLVQRLRPGGEIAIYVYRQKAPLRELADDWVRGQIGELSYDDALVSCAQVAELGRVLTEAGVTLRIPAVEVLGIEEGEYDLQRFVYHFLLKCFWNPELSAHENAVVNYDWYHPQDCTRHTRDEVLGWFGDAGLTVVQECVDPYGITMRGRAA